MIEHDELIPVFIEESQQHLQAIEPDLLALERSGSEIDADMVNRIFRGIHSIKGASGFFGFQNIGSLSHVMENVLSLMRDGKIKPSSKLIDALLSGVDALKSMLEDITGSEKFNIEREVAYLQRIYDETIGEPELVTVEEKKKGVASNQEGVRFNISAGDIQRFIREGLHLYAVKIYLNADLRGKQKTPYNFINNMESLGQYVDAFLDIRNVTGLSDCLENDLAFNFLFATVLDPDIVHKGLDLPPDRIRMIDLDEFKTEKKIETQHSEEPAKNEDDIPVSLNEAEPAADKTDDQIEDQTVAGIVRPIQAEEKIRVGVSFLNDLVNLAGELVLGRNQLLQTALPLVKTTPGLNPVLQHISRVTSEIQEKIMQMRMQPISMIFGKFQRVVRSLAKNHQKEVRLVTFGEEVELDKTIIEGLSDPLTHLIRNAVDHGIEKPDDREKQGKPRFGTIELKAYHQGGQVHLEILDDGRGIDAKFVSRKAVEKGVITHEQFNSMSEKDRIKLVFRPGFSTAEKITDLSGRGVGMDVVLTNIEHLGGTVDIDTKVGKGTKVTLVLPLTLAIVSGLLIKAGDQLFILPEIDIDELVRVKPDEMRSRINVVQDAWVLRLRDMLLPLVDLTSVLGIQKKESGQLSVVGGQKESGQLSVVSGQKESGQLSVVSGQKESGQLSVVGGKKAAYHSSLTTDHSSPLRILVIKQGASRFGLIVDSVVSTEEIVVKPLPRYLKKMRVFSGVSILGNGRVSLILDAAGILKKASIRHLEESKENIEKETSEDMSVAGEIQTLLLFDNNTKERFALPLELISRIERVPISRIEKIKDKQFLQYHSKKLRLIFIEDYLPVDSPQRLPDDTIGVIVPKQIKYPMGIVMNRVINTIDTVVELDTTTITAPGLFGTAVIDNRITLLPDMYRLFELAAPEWYGDNGKKKSKHKFRILLVDDTPFFRMVESEYLTSAGYEVLKADDGKKALQILEEEKVDAMLLDIIMPVMDGWETIKAIRNDERLKSLPVMAVTSLADDVMAQKGFQMGFDEWELKLDKTRLLEKLAKMLDRKS